MEQFKTTLSSTSISFWMAGGVIAIVALDQFVKYKIRHLGGFYVCNKGISFGLPIYTLFFWLIFGLFLLSILFYVQQLLKRSSLGFLPALGVTLLMGGGLSNGISRFWTGCVIDFINVYWSVFPLFNLADIAIFIGSILILISVFSKKDVL